MMDVALIQYVDVNQYYFGIEDIDFERFVCIFDDEKGLKVSMNHVVSKTKAIEKARQIFREEQNEFTKLYISADAMKVAEIKDYLGNKIFGHLSEDISGWLFFFDPIPFANWEHPCKYLLVVDECCIEKIEHQRGVTDIVQLEKIE